MEEAQEAEKWKMDKTTKGIVYLFFKATSLLHY